MKAAKALFVLLLIFATAARAQDPHDPAEAMQALGFLTGTWVGEGWIATREGRIPLASTELIQSKLDGKALLVEGIHRSPTSSGEEGEVLFEALALVTYHDEAGLYDGRSATSEGRGGNFEAKLIGDETLQWGQEGSFRYIIEIDEEGRWSEVGERTSDGGATWHQFFEMTLEKQE